MAVVHKYSKPNLVIHLQNLEVLNLKTKGVLPLLCSAAWFRCFLSDSLFTTGHYGFSSFLTVATTNFATEQRPGKWAWDSNFDETITKEQRVHSVSIVDRSS
jgi:hypothetical protein